MKLSSKERLLQAAVKAFASCGYDGTSTRQLASAAGVNISAITYYFGGKKGLYRAVLECISSAVESEFSEAIENARRVLASPDVSYDELFRLAQKLLGDFTRFLLSGKVPSSVVHILLREQVEPSEDFALLYNPTMKKMHETLSHLIARLTGLPFPGEGATICAHAIIGQIVVFKTHQAIAMQRLKWKKYGDREMNKIIEIVLRHMESIVDAYRRESKEKS